MLEDVKQTCLSCRLVVREKNKHKIDPQVYSFRYVPRYGKECDLTLPEKYISVGVKLVTWQRLDRQY